MKETLVESIKRLTFCRDCIDVSCKSGKMEYDRHDGMIEKMKKGGNTVPFPVVGNEL